MDQTETKNNAIFSLFGENGEIHPIPAGLDHFAFFGLPRKMVIDGAALETRYYDLSRKLHPDFFMNAPASKRILSLEASARLNGAYKTLKDPIIRAVYLVELESGKLEENDSRPPVDLLEEIFEAQEAADEYKCCEDDAEEARNIRLRLVAAKECFDAQRAGQRAALEDLGERWDRAVDAGDEPPAEVIDKLRSVLGIRNYIDNILRSVNQALEEVP
jgi:molecular chaperone HscB